MKRAKPAVMGIKTRCLLYVPSYANSLAKPPAPKIVGGESHSTPDGICVTHAKSHSKHRLQFLPYASNPRPLVTFNCTRVADYTLFLSPTIEGAPCYHPVYIPKPQPQVQAGRTLNFTLQYYFDLAQRSFLPITSYQNDTALITVERHASSPLHL